jgi:RNA polymerase sigma-70 factor (ECF subfamily)
MTDPNETVPDRGDAALVEQARQGDAGAFEALVRRHHAQVWRVVWRMVRQDQDAADIVQETFVAARRSLGELEGETSLAGWLLRIASSKARSFVRPRRAGRSPRPLVSDPPEERGERDAPERPLPPELTQALLEECVDRLDRDLLAAIAIQLEGVGYEEVARVLSVPVWTVRSRVFRARQALGSCVLGKRGGRA